MSLPGSFLCLPRLMRKRYPTTLIVARLCMFLVVPSLLTAVFSKTLWSLRIGRSPRIHHTLGDVRTSLSELVECLAYLQAENDKFYKGKNRPDWSEELLTRDDEDDSDEAPKQDGAVLEKRYAPSTIATLNLIDERVIPYDLIVRLLEDLCFGDPEYLSYSSAVLVFMPGLAEIRRLHDMLTEHSKFGSNDFKLYPLHSTLTSENQAAVFDIPPAGIRKIVIGVTTLDFVSLP